MWLKLDDSFADHPKIVGLSDSAFRLHVRALCYCARFLTDGEIPASFTKLTKAVKELVSAGLWEPFEGGWRIHDWLDYQPSREEVQHQRSGQREQRRVAGQARASDAQRDASGRFQPEPAPAGGLGGSHPPAPSRPVPVPEPVPEPVPDQSRPKNLAVAVANGDGVWATMIELWGEPPKAERYRTAWGIAKNEILAQGIDPAEMRRRYQNAGTRTWAIVTPPAFAKHVGLLARPEPRQPKQTDRLLGLANELERRGE